MLKKVLSSLGAAVLMIALPLPLWAGPLTPGAFVVDAGSYRYWSFEVSRSARVFGQFRTQAGGGNDIRVLVIDEDEFENFRSGRNVRSYSDSGRVTAGELDLRLRSGRYVLIFDNRSSPYSNRSIASKLELAED